MPFTKTIEREVKLEADLVFELPDLRAGHKTVRRAPQKLNTAYFDTAELRLWRRGITLRHRAGDRSSGPTWTLKLPELESAETLNRAELSWPGPREAIPAEATEILLGILRRAKLSQVVQLETIRRRLILRDTEGESAELADDVVTVVGGHRDGHRFRQLELEVEADGGPMAKEVLRLLRAAGARPGGQPKLALALGLPATGDGDGGETKRRQSLAEVVRASINGALDRLLEHDYRLRLRVDDPAPHDVHQARVATRRLRSDLKMYRPVLDPVWLDHTRGELEWLAEMLGKIRDLDVLAARLGRDDEAVAEDKLEGRDEIGAELVKRRRAECQALAQHMVGDRYLDLLDRIHASAERPPFYPGAAIACPGDAHAEQALLALVRRPWLALRKRVRRAGPEPSDRELHLIRIAAKQLRYASESAAPVAGKPAARMAATAEKLQTVLGEHHDAVAAEAWLRASVPTLTPAASFEAGRLAAEQEWRQRELRREWRRVWDELNNKKLRHWLA
jgi:CHAD domain-containing protein